PGGRTPHSGGDLPDGDPSLVVRGADLPADADRRLPCQPVLPAAGRGQTARAGRQLARRPRRVTRERRASRSGKRGRVPHALPDLLPEPVLGMCEWCGTELPIKSTAATSFGTTSSFP